MRWSDSDGKWRTAVAADSGALTYSRTYPGTYAYSYAYAYAYTHADTSSHSNAYSYTDEKPEARYRL